MLHAIKFCEEVQLPYFCNKPAQSCVYLAYIHVDYCYYYYHSRFTTTVYGPFSGTTRVSRCQKRTSGLYGARED